MKKNLFKVGIILLVLVMATGCAAPSTNPNVQSPTQSSTAPAASQSAEEKPEYPEVSLDINEIYGKGPAGEPGANYKDMTITPEEAQKLKDGKFKVAFVYHQLSNEVNQTKLRSSKELMEKYGVEVVSESNGEYNVEKLVSNMETAIAMKPDVIITTPMDPDALASVCRQAVDSGIKLIFMQDICTGFVPGKDYVAMVSADNYGHGRFAADYMAYKLGYKGKIAMVFEDRLFFPINQRDTAFRETMASKYPDIEIVMEAGFPTTNQAGVAGDAVFAKYPKIDGVWVSWAGPAEYVLASAQSYNRNDLVMTTVDLDDNVARIIASDGLYKGVGAPRTYETGQAEGMTILYALLDKELPSTYICTPTMACVKENILEAYEACFNKEPPQEIKDIVEASK